VPAGHPDQTRRRSFKALPQNQSLLTQTLSRLLAVSERYPDIKAKPEFPVAATQSRHENRIAWRAARLHRAVRQYNTELRTIPGPLDPAISIPIATRSSRRTSPPKAGAMTVP